MLRERLGRGSNIFLNLRKFMEIMTKKYEVGHLQAEEIQRLLDLQKENLPINLDAQTIDSQGYVSFVYDPTIINRMRADEPQIIARSGNEVVGYALVATIGAMGTIPVAIPMLYMIEQLIFRGKPCKELKYYIVGQVCVKAGFRGQGMLEGIYAEHRAAFSGRYDCAITEIASDNKRSLAAHHRIGFETIHTFYDATGPTVSTMGSERGRLPRCRQYHDGV